MLHISLQSKKAKIWLTAVGLVLAAVGYSAYEILAPVERGSSRVVEVSVATGQGTSAIAGTLAEQGLIRSEFFFVVYAHLAGWDRQLKAGTYKLSGNMSTAQILRILAEGKAESTDIQVVIPEGSNIWDIDLKLFQAGLLAHKGDFARTQQKYEGYLFPDTYRFSAQLATRNSQPTNPDRIADIMRDNFFSKAGNNLNPSIVIIASMLEKEGKTTQDLELISGIIENRMQRGMLLQIDATVGYGWCMKQLALRHYEQGCDVTQAPIANEITLDGPYNSYIRKGLPVGPISNPGLRAIQAAQHPTASDYLFYLSTRDGSQIIYAKTPQEQSANRRKYLGI